jgi:multidrug efflux system outer membrane protein
MALRRKRTASLGGAAAALVAALAACAPVPESPALRFAFAPRYQGASAAVPVLLANVAWWQRLEDPLLDRLIAEARRGNLSLAQARERVVAARAARAQVPGAGTANASVRAGGEGFRGEPLEQGGGAALTLDWAFDPAGGRRSEIAAAEARVTLAAAEADAADLLVLSELATAYLDLRYRQRLVALAQAEQAARSETLALTRRLQTAGEATAMEIARAEARLASIRADLPGLAAEVTAGTNEIAVLVGAAPGGLPADLARALANGRGQPRPRLAPEVGIPADLLRNRPDIRVAEAAYVAAVADIGAAHAALYPRLSLLGEISVDALDLSEPDRFLGPVVTFPELPLGPARARVEERQSRAREAYDRWRETVLTALLEVENALARYAAVAASTAAAAEAVRLHREALGLTRRVYEAGEATLGDLVDAEEDIAEAERRLAGLRRDHAQAFVALNVRLGAGHAAR